MPRNRLLAALPAEEWARFRRFLHPVTLSMKMALMRSGSTIEAAYFVESGSVSMIALLEDGARIEVGLVGPEGLVGLQLVLGTTMAPLDAMVQVPGSAQRLSAGSFAAALAEAPSLTPLLLRFVDSFHAQVSQTAACNGRHQIEQRLARWLLMTRDRAGADEFPMTHEFLATMLGVRRPGVTVSVGILKRAGLVQHTNGRIRIVDRKGLEAAACECYDIVRRRYEWPKDAD